MNSDKKSTYRFSFGRLFYTIWHILFSNDWIGATIFTLGSIFIYSFWTIFSQKYLIDNTFTPAIDSLVGAIVFGSLGYWGYLSAKHRYVPSKSGESITGKPALVTGIIMMIIFWGFTIYFLYLAVSKFIDVI